jgi:5-methylcytosine-specific restriction endonuclease McrA
MLKRRIQMLERRRSRLRVRYIRVAKIPVESVLPFVFTKDVRHKLRSEGVAYDSLEWKNAGQRTFFVKINKKTKAFTVPMGSQRYELFASKGIKCVDCGIEGSYFALEKDISDSTSRFHLNLYGKDENGDEVMITKDHILPKSKGGENKLSNYQPMCYKCNQKKADKIIW